MPGPHFGNAAEHDAAVTITRGWRAVARRVPDDGTNGTALAGFPDAWAGWLDDENAEQFYRVREQFRKLPRYGRVSR